MKKYFRILIIAMILVSLVMLAACTQTREEEETTIDTTVGQTEDLSVIDVTADDGIGGDDRDCYIHDAQYHRAIDLFVGGLADYIIDLEKVHAWSWPLNDLRTSPYDECLVNLSTFIEHFNISKETLEKFINDNNELLLEWEINLDVLYSGDKELIDEYYSIENEELNRQRGLERLSNYYGEKIVELQLIVNEKDEMSSSYHDIWTFDSFLYPGGLAGTYVWMKQLVDAGQYDKVNIVEYAHHFGFTKEGFEKLVEEHNMDIYAVYDSEVIFSGNQKRIEGFYSIENEEAQSKQIKTAHDMYVKSHGKTDASRIPGQVD